MNEHKEDTKKSPRRAFQKSRPYPYYDISTALDFAKRIERYGDRNISEPILVKDLGLKSSNMRSFTGRVSSAKYFGLIISDGKNYSLTERGMLILRPKDEDEKENLLMESFLTPDLYKDLHARFQGKQIPTLDIFANILNHDYGINKNVSRDAAKAFIESAKFVGIIDQNNTLKSYSHGKDEGSETILSKEMPVVPRQAATPNTLNTVTTTVELSKGIVSITLPKGGITKQDSERLKKFLDAVVYVIEED